MNKRNRVKCKNCGDVIESTHQHHWVSCSCYKLNQLSDVGIDASELLEFHGIWIDGGPSSGYTRYGGNMDDFEDVLDDE